jgi:hypothetical protein
VKLIQWLLLFSIRDPLINYQAVFPLAQRLGEVAPKLDHLVESQSLVK